MKKQMNTWSSLESLPGLNAIPSIWREKLGGQFDLFRAAFLQTRPVPAQSFPCRRCGCAHDVTIHAPGDIVAVCACDPWNCDDLVLTADDIQILELNWSKLARSLCKAFGLDARPVDIPLHNTRQIGSWSADGVPVILTIQHERRDFQDVVQGLAARRQQKFILLAPTSANFDATSQEILAGSDAGFFALDSHVIFTEQGTLQSARAPGQLFARFTPEAKEPPHEDVARQAFAIAKALDSEQPMKPPTVFAIFRLYCQEELSAAQIAHKCGCSKATVISRLNLLRQKLGRNPAELRRYSAHFGTIEESLSDPRAKRVYRKGAIYGDEEGEEA